MKYVSILRTLGLQFLLLVIIPIAALAQPATDPSHAVSANKHLPDSWKKELWSTTHKIYEGKELETIGMPCGGIAAGQLYVRGDGTLANWWISNNAYNTGYGKDSLMNFPTALGPWKVCYQTFTPPSYIDQGFMLQVKQGGRTVTSKLNKNDFDDISFTGEYPIANIDYASALHPLPVSVSLEVFSPFIPLDARESATPGTIMKYRFKNTSSTPLDLSITGWVQNLVCLDLKGRVDATSRNTITRGDGMTGVFMDVVNPRFIDSAAGPFPGNHPYIGNLALNVFDSHGFVNPDFSGSVLGSELPVAEKKLGEKLVGSVGSSFLLKPGETRDVVFVLTWFFPNRPSYYFGNDVTKIIPNDWNEALPVKGATILGNMYANWYSSSRDVALWLYRNLPRLSSETHRFHDSYYNNTTLPYWLAQRLMMPVSTLATETCQWWSNNKFWAWEGVGSCVGTCTHVWNYEQALSRIFPELERNIREKTDFETSFQQDGSILARNGWGDVLIDGDAGAILKAYREHLFSGNNLFLSRNWPQIRKAMQYLITQDENEDGLIEKQQANTYDIAFYGANTYVGGLYLAALKAADRMALIMQDTTFAKRCERIFASGRDKTVEKLWNGYYFKQDVDLSQHPRFQYANGCLSDQLLGQTWAHLDDLGYIYPKEKVRTTLESIWKYNWASDVGPQNRLHPPERVYADPGEAGLLVCTWPFGKHMGDSGVRYRDEVWTGIEYQVAANMIYEGMTDEGLSVVKAVHDRYKAGKHNPWNEIECGDHYARALASWSVLLALEDYHFNGPLEKMTFSPKIQQANFKAFFTSSEGWGSIAQHRTTGGQTNTVTVDYGKTMLRSLETAVAGIPRTVEVKKDGKRWPCTYTLQDNHLIATFAETSIEKGSRIELSVIYR